ncbi:hypothetical protein [Macrococcus capreoli]|uniref:hypothetical protein n=1 Tax=Macrococcus capreoli TaxID=2982690 RepID=UPI0021D5F228|nr:hypothetical protein [Macrococcus sp. TMW 2.2395]MCU7557282.1 hypothetical protein [Macrococcus sp. TMW 2.2395]
MPKVIYDGLILTEQDIDLLNAGNEIKLKSHNGTVFLVSKQVKAKSQYYDITFNLYKDNLMIVEDGLFSIFATGVDSAISKLQQKYKNNTVEIIKIKSIRSKLHA